jgi:ATP-dependent helicase/nuclease subunit A
VLDFVNAVINTADPAEFGISDAIEDHYGEKADVGLIELLAPVAAKPTGEVPSDNDDDEEAWISDEKRKLAKKLAEYAKALIDERPWLVTKGRHLQPGDIMFLLRSRGDLASLLVAQLHDRVVPVAGIDRLRLLQPLVVQDLLAAVRFVLQPEDDLSLACLLVSPLIGWTQERLLAHGYRGDRQISLWQHLREQDELAEDIAPIRDMLASADFTTVFQFLEQILSGPAAGRQKFVARLGSESLIPMEEMLNAALLFEQQHCGGLQAFLHWFDRGDNEIKREGESGANEVRVMTVHGAKGLQAPVVILADTTSDPTKKPDQSAELLVDEGRRIPMLPIRKAEQSDRLAKIVERQQARELQEHKRLLYVAMTRAEERLVMGGSLGVSRKGEAPQDSWYTALERGMSALGSDWQPDDRWGRVMRYVGADGMAATATSADDDSPFQAPSAPDRPSWLFEPAPNEQRPPRPLMPSRLDDDDYGDSPASVAMRAAAERGKLIHALFERLTDGASIEKAERWLAQNNRDRIADNAAIMSDVRAVFENPEWAVFFGASARAEVPLAALVGETVITGRVDRLVVEPGFIRILDFKTGRRIPQNEHEVPLPHVRQMAHYVAALEMIFPGSAVEANLLFTHAPKLLTLSDQILAPHKPAPNRPSKSIE